MNHSPSDDRGVVVAPNYGYLLNLVDATVRRQQKDNVTPGLTLIADKKHNGSVHSSSHSKIHRYAEKCGFEYIPLRTDEPMWIRTRHRQTESNILQTDGALDVSSLVDEKWDELQVDFGIDVDACRRYFHEQERYPLFSYRKSMIAKNRIRSEIRKLERREPLGPADAKKLERLTKAYREAGSNLFATPDPESILTQIVVTPFGFDRWKQDQLEFELGVLERFALASLDNQSIRDFLWLVCVNRELPSSAIGMLEKFEESRPNLHLLKMAAFSAKEVLMWMRGTPHIDGRYYLSSTALDHRDALSRTFVESIKKTIIQTVEEDGQRQGYVLWIPRGFIYSPRSARAVRVDNRRWVWSGRTLLASPYSELSCFSVPPLKIKRFSAKRDFKEIALEGERWMAAVTRHRSPMSGIDTASTTMERASPVELSASGFDFVREAGVELARSPGSVEPMWWKLARLRIAAAKFTRTTRPTP